MTLKIITWMDPDGQYHVTSPAFKAVCETQQLNDDDLIAKIIGQLKETHSLPTNQIFHVVDNDAQLSRLSGCCGSYFWHTQDGSPGAWDMDPEGLPVVNMARARGLHMDYIRKARNAELIRTDLAFMRAVEGKDTNAQAMISAEKQTLRDIPQTFDLTARTPAALMGKWPIELPARTA